MKIERVHKIEESYRVATIRGMFDFDNEESKHEWNVELNLPSDWKIGVIVGPSGSGKTTIGTEYFGKDSYFTGYEWSNKSVVDDFPDHLDIQDITTALSSVGFSSPPCWLQPFNTLSNGQKFRVEMARVLFDERDIVVVDEYTSVVDRTVAQIGSNAIQKYIRKNVKDKQIVLLSCHYDILDWLQPDWVYDVSSEKMTIGRDLWQRPTIVIEMYECSRKDWPVFRSHHYLNHGPVLNSSKCYAFYVNGVVAAFSAIVPFVGKLKNTWREHRTVVLPDFQGFGLGMIVGEMVGEMLHKKNLHFTSATSHPALIHARAKSPKWSCRGQTRPSMDNDLQQKTKKATTRIMHSFLYVGDRGFDYLKGWKDG